MHAPVQAAEVRDIAQGLRPAQHKGVVQADLDIGVFVHRRQHRVEPRRAVVVQQQAHAYAAVGRGMQGFQQHRARHVVVPDVVLHVQAAFSGARQHHAGGEGVIRIGQRVDARLAGVGRRQWGDAAAQGRGGRLFGRQRLGFAALVQRRQAASA
ncbi:hypothetical protein D3C71_1605360 [compost metagenome]